MKIRNGFVSNSSSSSFILNKKDLTAEQIEQIKNYVTESVRLVNERKARFDSYPSPAIPDGMTEDDYYDLPDLGYKDNDWQVSETDKTIECHCIIDNFQMDSFFRVIGINNKIIRDAEQ